jgi:hypothetical protein
VSTLRSIDDQCQCSSSVCTHFPASPLRRNAPRLILPRLYNTEAPSRPQFATASPTPGASVTHVNTSSPIVATPPPTSSTLTPPSSPPSQAPPINISTGGNGSGGGQKKKRGFFKKVGRFLGYGSVLALASGSYCECLKTGSASGTE